MPPPPPELRPRISEVTTQTVVVESTLDGGGDKVTVKFVQFEPSGRVVEYRATLTHVTVLRDVGPEIDFGPSENVDWVEEGMRRAEAAERRRAGAQALVERMARSGRRSGPY